MNASVRPRVAPAPSPSPETVPSVWTSTAPRALAVAAGLILLAACRAPSSPVPSAEGRAGVIVGFPDGAFRDACVSFEGGEITGEDLLRQSTLAVTMDARNALGTLVCSIAGEGCNFPDEPCLCRCRGAGPCSYWAYFNWDPENGWVYAAQGARLRTLRDGDLDAWIWLDRSLPSDEVPLPPSNMTFEGVCD